MAHGHGSSKYEITKALAGLFKSAGFDRDGADWVRAVGDVRWELFLSVDRVNGADEFDVAIRAAAPAAAGRDAELLMLSSLRRLVMAPHKYKRGYTEGSQLVADARDVLLPLIDRFPDSESVLRGYLDGRWSERGGGRATELGQAWQGARRLNHRALRDDIERAVHSRNWTPEDRWTFRWYGLDIGGPYREYKPKWWQAIFKRDSPLPGGLAGAFDSMRSPSV